MKKVLHAYCRVSSGIQETEGTSLQSQQQLAKLKAKQLGFKVKIWNETSASSDHEEIDKRPVLSSLMTAIDDGLIQHLYVTEMPRLATKDNVASVIRFNGNSNNVTLYIKDTVYDFSNAMDVLTVQIMSAFSQFENALRKERSRLGKLQKVKQGYWHGGVPPYGYTLKQYKNGNKLMLHPKESATVKNIFKWYRSEQSTKFIQTKLRENYVQARRGGSFSLGSIVALIKNTHYTGTYTFTDGVSNESVEVKCPRIVTDSIWNECQQRREFIQKRKGQINRTVHFSLLKEMLWCGHCGTGMGAKIQPSQNKNYYYCPKKERSWKEDNNSFSGLKKDTKATHSTKKDKRWDRGRHCEMVRSLNVPVTNDTVWKAITEIATKSHVLKEQVKSQLLSTKTQSDTEQKSAIRNLEKTKQQYVDERAELLTALDKIETDRVMNRISVKQTKSIKINIGKELEIVNKRIKEVTLKLEDYANQQKWVDWTKEFKKTYANVDKFTDQQKQSYLLGLVKRIDVRLDSKTNEHMLDVSFNFPVVADKYVKSGKSYKVINGKDETTLKGNFNSKNYGRDGVKIASKSKKKRASKSV